MKKVFVMFLMLVGSVFGLLSCKAEGVTIEALSGKSYLLTNMFEKNDIFISFDGDRFAGKSAINNFFGTYRIDNGSKFVANDAGMSTGMTMMAGSPDDMENDQKFMDLFNDIDTIALKDKTLTFTTESGEKLVFIEADKATTFPETEGEPVGDLGLASDLVAFIGKEFKLANMFEGSDVTFVIIEEGKIGGKSAVNTYMATYTANGDEFVVGQAIGTTRMAGDPAQMEVEKLYLEILPNVVSINILENMLVLTTKDGVELIFEQL